MGVVGSKRVPTHTGTPLHTLRSTISAVATTIMAPSWLFVAQSKRRQILVAVPGDDCRRQGRSPRLATGAALQTHWVRECGGASHEGRRHQGIAAKAEPLSLALKQWRQQRRRRRRWIFRGNHDGPCRVECESPQDGCGRGARGDLRPCSRDDQQRFRRVAGAGETLCPRPCPRRAKPDRGPPPKDASWVQTALRPFSPQPAKIRPKRTLRRSNPSLREDSSRRSRTSSSSLATPARSRRGRAGSWGRRRSFGRSLQKRGHGHLSSS